MDQQVGESQTLGLSNEAPSVPNQSGTPKKLPSKFILISLFLVVIIALGYFSIKFVLETKTNSILPDSNLSTAEPIATETSTQKESLQIPLEENWDKYEASCSGLKNDITVYYPQLWKMGKDGETQVSDAPQDPESECQITFGYPVTPGGRQDPLYPGLRGYVTVASTISQYKNLSEAADNFDNEYYKNDVIYITNIADRQWVKVIFNRDSSVFMQTMLMTIYKGRFYMVSYSVVDEKTLDASSSARILDIGQEFIHKLEFH